MRKKNPHIRSAASKPAASTAAESTPSSLLPLLSSGRLLAVVAVIVAAIFIPSEGAIIAGSYVPLVMLVSMLVLGIALLSTQEQDFAWGLHPAEGIAAALIGWHSVSALVATYTGNARHSLNAMWVWIGYGLIAFFLRRLVRNPQQQRAVIAVLIAVGGMLAVHGYYQYYVSFPQMRAEFAAERDKITAGTEQNFAPGTPEYELLGARVRSPEPLATFSLTNSLAGYLAPWLVATIAIGISQLRLGSKNVAGILAIEVILVGCLLLTQSRAGVIATACGTTFVVASVFLRHWNFNRRLVFAGIAGLALLSLVLFAWSAANEDWWRGAPTSLRYRFEYWHATLQMIRDYPLLGCGPGNFQDYYTQYKLPQASETVADPHNFLLEIAATAGLPALGLALAGLAVAAGSGWLTFRPLASELEAESNPRRDGIRPIYLGGLAGVVISIPLSILVLLNPETIPRSFGLPVYVLLGLPVAAAMLWILHGWVRDGSWTIVESTAVLLTLLVNLFAAGSTIFPGVFLTAWIITAFALPLATNPSQGEPNAKPWLPWLLTSAAALLAIACYTTAYRPLLNANFHLSQGFAFHSLGRTENAAEEMRLATLDDPWSVEAWRGLAEIRLHVWLMQPTDRNESLFTSAAEQFLRRTPHSYRAAQVVGHWQLRMYRASGRDAWLAEAVRSYEQAVVLYPHNAFVRAQLAWIHHLRKDEPAARKEAAEALRLDDLNPHGEQQLVKRHLEDVAAEETKTPQPLPKDSARKIMEKLSKAG